MLILGDFDPDTALILYSFVGISYICSLRVFLCFYNLLNYLNRVRLRVVCEDELVTSFIRAMLLPISFPRVALILYDFNLV